MLLVIFGAGATCDAVPGPVRQRPPLAKDLFAHRNSFGPFIDAYPAIRTLIPRLRAAAQSEEGGVTVEHELERIVADSHDRQAVRRQLAAVRFYIHDAIKASVEQCVYIDAHGVTNYHLLVDKIDACFTEVPVLYVTFNYDTLLETALEDNLGQSFRDMSAYIANPRRRVIKLHGSVGWRRRVVMSNPLKGQGSGDWVARWLIDHVDEAQTTSDYAIRPFLEYADSSMYLPAIAIPTESKTGGDFELPADHLGTLRNSIPQISQVLIVGWRGREDHFWELWNNIRPQSEQLNVAVVDANASSAGEVIRHITERGLSTTAQALPVDGFSAYMAQPELRGLFFA